MQIDEDYINRRIDKYLRDKYDFLQSKICVLSKQKKILVNNVSQNFNYRLKKGDIIKVLDNDFYIFHNSKNNIIKNCRKYDNDKTNKRQNCRKNQNVFDKNKSKNKSNVHPSESQDAKFSRKNNKNDLPIEMVYKIKQSIIFENDDVLVINKPYGISVQGGTGVKYCLEDFFHLISDKKLRIVHRIDKDTRGLLILAKNVPTAVKLTDMFRKREVFKTYLAVLSGIPLKNSGTIKTYIFLSKKDNIAGNAHSTEERMNGKEAITKYKVLKTNKENNTSLVEFHPLTGRKHQIRLHAQNIKCPIIGDEKYGFGKQKNKKLQLFAVAIDASPVVKVELSSEEIQKMINF